LTEKFGGTNNHQLFVGRDRVASVRCLSKLSVLVFGDRTTDSKLVVRDWKRRSLGYKAELPMVPSQFSAPDVVRVLSDVRMGDRLYTSEICVKIPKR
jgi:hypothetical protein